MERRLNGDHPEEWEDKVLFLPHSYRGMLLMCYIRRYVDPTLLNSAADAFTISASSEEPYSARPRTRLWRAGDGEGPVSREHANRGATWRERCIENAFSIKTVFGRRRAGKASAGQRRCSF